MSNLDQTSFGDYLSRKMSVWILVLVATITVAVFGVSFIQSRQMFIKQVISWTTIVPRQAIANLIDSDNFSIEREVKFLESTALFSDFCIMDNQQRKIAAFGKQHCTGQELIPIKDDVGVIWGYYSFRPDFYRFILPFLLAGMTFLVLIISLYFFINRRIRKNLGHEFFRFNQFLQNIESLTERIQDYYQDELTADIGIESPHNAEQVIINRAIGKLVHEIKKANQSLREAISNAEKKRFQEELTETALQVAHDIGSPLATLGAVVQSASFVLPEESCVAIRNAASKIRDIANSLLKKAKRDLQSINASMLTQQPLYSIVNEVITEKRLQYQNNKNINIELDEIACGLFVTVRIADFSSVLSNIVNNSIESFESAKGNILISLHDSSHFAIVRIKDDGKGIPREVLPELGKMGVTYGKAGGNGLGLYNAKSTIESLGGRLEIESQLGQWTEVNIMLPKAPSPHWFVPALMIAENQNE